MKLRIIMWIVIITKIFQVANTMKSRYQNEHDYYDFEPEGAEAEVESLADIQKPNSLVYGSNGNGVTDSMFAGTTCITITAEDDGTAGAPATPPSAAHTGPGHPGPGHPSHTGGATIERPATSSAVDEGTANCIQDDGSRELQNLVQLLYIAQARVQLEASEIKKAQAIANSAQHSLEEAANNVRAISAAMQSAQQEVANAAIRAQTAQLQLAAHDQLLFAARQDVDALSSQMVALQAAAGFTETKMTVDVNRLMDKLKQPLKECETPTAIPPVVPLPVQAQLQQEHGSSFHGNPYYN